MGAVRDAWSWRAAGIALVVAAGYAATDEFHQSFVVTRGASIADVGVDIGGAILGLALAFLASRISRALRERRRPGAAEAV